MLESLKPWGDKLLMMTLIIVFLITALYGYTHKEADLSSACIDLVKQVLAAYLILTNSQRLPFGKQNGGQPPQGEGK